MLLTHDQYCRCPECQARRPYRDARRALWQNIKDLEIALERADRALDNARGWLLHRKDLDDERAVMIREAERGLGTARAAVESAYQDLKARGMVLHYGGGVLVPHAVIGEYAWFDPQDENWIGRRVRDVRGVAAYAPLSEDDPCWRAVSVADCWAAVEARYAGAGS